MKAKRPREGKGAAGGEEGVARELGPEARVHGGPWGPLKQACPTREGFEGQSGPTQICDLS